MEQETRDYCMSLVKELIDGVDAGDFSQPMIPEKYSWEHLFGLYLLRDELDGGVDLYRELFDMAVRSGETYIKEKAKRGEKIKVVFQTYSAAEWPAEDVYRLFEAMPNVDVKVVVSPLADRELESLLDTYKQTSKWFKDNGYQVIDGLDVSKMTYGDWTWLGGMPDVLYQVSSWFNCLPNPQWFTKLPLRSLVAYIPYGISQADSADGRYSIDSVFNKEIVNLMWRVYATSEYAVNSYCKHQTLQGINVRNSGYAKMDYFYRQHDLDESTIRKLWKIPSDVGVDQRKRVIIAPHYTVFSGSEICYSTFQKNVWFWLYLAKKYENQITFLFKPHPNLRRASVGAHIFESFEEYDAYVENWNTLVNGTAVQEGDYRDYFATSDAMIMDSVSFLAEYLYTGKPMLYLTRPEQTFNDSGKSLLGIHYKAPGEDYVAIEQFIQDVVLDGNDTMAEKRKRVFEEKYDYYNINGQLASDFIVNEVKELIS